mmetsp:Transcript_2760/g.4642  ORF Transcript_2760/g.4642 Transcript_2760/m.4642 type:complete len:398 (-) Transcript_2760:34-1227(-)
MSKITKDIFVVASKRTAFGSFGGTIKNMSAVELGTIAAKGAVAQLPSADIIDSVHVGNVAQSTTDCAYLARHVGLKAGVKDSAPALTVNRLCGSGFQSIVSGCQDIMLGDSQVVLTGGAESMSLAPYSSYVRWGSPLGVNPPMIDTLWDTLNDKHAGCPMAITAENLAEKYDITKEQSDELAFRSQQLWGKANEEGLFKDEIEPIMIKDRKKGEVAFDTDEHPRPQTTLESLAKLKPLFKKGGVVTAGNASGISDGAGAVVVASGEAVNQHGLKPMARVVSYGIAGVPPEIMGFGPVPAMQMALERAGLTMADMDLIEINEAFAAQFLACQKVLEFDMDKANLQGGAVALGHPTGASGSRIMGHLAYELQRTGKKYAIGSACIGGGQGIAIILENPN